MQTVAITGVGLIGGSFALALRKAGFGGRILGVGSARTVRAALDRGVIDEGVALEAAVRRADLVYLSQPISGILERLREIDPWLKPGALVTDAGSTKARIVAEAARSIRRAQFLGGHPMAGKESRGVESSDADLFRGRVYLLTPASPEELETEAARAFIGWIERIGAHPAPMNPEEHDRLVAFTSHLPQLASTGLASMLSERLHGADDAPAAGPGLADMTRLALSSYDVWRDILTTNAEAIDGALAAYIGQLEKIRAELGSESMAGRFEAAAAFRRRMKSGPGTN